MVVFILSFVGVGSNPIGGADKTDNSCCSIFIDLMGSGIFNLWMQMNSLIIYRN